MKIVIIGIGKTGYELAHRLSDENHDVTVIDNDSNALNIVRNTQDVFCVQGDGVDRRVLESASVQIADLVIATAESDEINIVCCFIARKLGAKRAIARIRRPELSRSVQSTIQSDLGINMTINPELAAAKEISRIMRFPSAVKVDIFAKGKVETVECKILPDSPLDGVRISEIKSKFKTNVLICVVQRKEETVIPNGSFVLKAGDQISITGAPAEIADFFEYIGILQQKIKSVMIVGGGKISFYVARMLGDLNLKVKIIETDYERCTELSKLLPKAMIINGNGADEELLIEEGIDSVDALMSLTGLDEENVVISMYALSRGVGKVITKINHITFGAMLEKTGIDCIITPHSIASGQILRYIRSLQGSIGSSVEALARIANGKAEALEFNVKSGFRGCGVKLRDIKLKDGLLVACIIRNEQLIYPRGDDAIQENDNVIVITADNGYGELNEILD